MRAGDRGTSGRLVREGCAERGPSHPEFRRWNRRIERAPGDVESGEAAARRISRDLPKEIASAIRLLVERNRVVAEGAGGSSVAAALAGKAGEGRIVCVVSGGNLDTEVLGKILRGEVP